jgi:hypothetical protein
MSVLTKPPEIPPGQHRPRRIIATPPGRLDGLARFEPGTVVRARGRNVETLEGWAVLGDQTGNGD